MKEVVICELIIKTRKYACKWPNFQSVVDLILKKKLQ